MPTTTTSATRRHESATTIIGRIEAATASGNCEDLFGKLTGPKATQLEALRDSFQAMAWVLHPDRAGKSKKATDAMGRLTNFRRIAKDQVEAGAYGKPVVAPVTIKSKLTYSNVVALAAGDISDVYRGDCVVDHVDRHAVIKICRDLKNTDLVTNEARIIKQLAESDDPDKKIFLKYVPRLIETTRIQVGTEHRPANIFTRRDGFIPITDLLKAYPNGLDPRDVAWIWRRMLEGLTWIHRQGIVHGAITPAHILVSLTNHGGNLIDWSYALDIRKNPSAHVLAISPAYRDYYPPEVFRKDPATPALDLYMLTKCMVALHGAVSIPVRIRRLIDACLIPNPARRHTSAAEVYQQYDAILKMMYGPPTFRELKLP